MCSAYRWRSRSDHPFSPLRGLKQAALKPGQPAEAASGQSELSSDVDGQQAVTPPAPPVSPAQQAALKPGQPAEAASGQSELSSDVEGRQAVTPPAPPLSPAQEAALKPGQPAEAASGQSELSSDVEGRQAVTPPAPPLSPAQEAALKPGQPAEAASGQSELSSDVEERKPSHRQCRFYRRSRLDQRAAAVEKNPPGFAAHRAAHMRRDVLPDLKFALSGMAPAVERGSLRNRPTPLTYRVCNYGRWVRGKARCSFPHHFAEPFDERPGPHRDRLLTV